MRKRRLELLPAVREEGGKAMSTKYVLDADKIDNWRIDSHVPLKQLARAAGVNLSSLSHAIREGREVKMNFLLNLADAMGEDPRDIVKPKTLTSHETKEVTRLGRQL